MALRNRAALTNVLNQENVKNIKSAVNAGPGPTRRAALGEIGNKVTLRAAEPTNKTGKLQKAQIKVESNVETITKPQIITKPADKQTVPADKTLHVPGQIESLNDHQAQVAHAEKAKIKSEAFSSDLLAIEDIDEVDRNNPILVTIYSNDIYKYLRELEAKYPIQRGYLTGQEITVKMRSVLIDWLVEVHQQFHLLQETLYLTVAVIDRFLQSYRTITRKRLQLVGVAAMFLSCKYEEMYAPDISDFVFITDNAYTKAEILHMEMLIARTLDYSFGRPLPLHFLRRYSKAGRSLPAHHVLAKYFLEHCLVHHEMCHYPPSLIAAAALYLSFFIIKDSSEDEKELIWTNTLVHYSTYTKVDIMPVVREMAKLIVNVDKSKYQAVKKKYVQAKHMKISLRPELKSPSMLALAKTEKE